MLKKFLIFFYICLISFSFSSSVYAEEIKSITPLEGSAVINLNSDKIEYFQETDQFVATGNVSINLEDQDTVIESKKVIYDKTKNLIIAENEVKIIKRGQVITGDYARFDLTKEEGLLGNPSTLVQQIKINAEVANIYPESTDVLNGKATINDKDLVLVLSSNEFALKNRQQLNLKSASEGRPKYTIHSKEIIVKRNKDWDIITLKNATIKIGKYKIAKIPAVTLSSDREITRIETTFPEIGHEYETGSYFGYGPVFYLPGASTLKIAPLIAIGNGDNGSVGLGALTRFTSRTNRTEVIFSSLRNQAVVTGEQKLFSNDTKLQYGVNSYIENGFLGIQKPKAIVEAVDYRKVASYKDFDAFPRTSAGYAEDYGRCYGTGRFQLQGEFKNAKPLFTIGENTSFGISSQMNLSAYGTGHTFGLLRAGPTVATVVGPFNFWGVYYQAGVYGDTPFLFDRYMYGKSNVMVNTNYKISKFLTFGYFGSFNLSKDNWEKKLISENQFYFWIGPEDIKFKLGFDTKRKRTTWGFDMMIGSERSALEFDKLRIIEN